MKYELQLQMNFRSAFGELKRQTKDNVSCSESDVIIDTYPEVFNQCGFRLRETLG